MTLTPPLVIPTTSLSVTSCGLVPPCWLAGMMCVCVVHMCVGACGVGKLCCILCIHYWGVYTNYHFGSVLKSRNDNTQ